MCKYCIVWYAATMPARPARMARIVTPNGRLRAVVCARPFASGGAAGAQATEQRGEDQPGQAAEHQVARVRTLGGQVQAGAGLRLERRDLRTQFIETALVCLRPARPGDEQ